MKRHLRTKLPASLLILMVLPSLVKAQIRTDVAFSGLLPMQAQVGIGEQFGNAFILNFNGQYISNVISPGDLAPSYLGGSESTINVGELYGRLRDENVVGLETDFKVGYYAYNIQKSQKWGFFAEYTRSNQLAGKLGKNLADLFYNGNAKYAGETLSTEDDWIQQYQLHSLGLGVFKPFEALGKKWLLKSNVNLLAGSNLFRAEIRKLELYTEPYGEYIDADFDFSIWESNGNFLAGSGLSLDVAIGVELNDKSSAAIKVQSLGFISWSQSATHEVSGNTSTRIEGLPLKYENLGNFDNEAIDEFVDSLSGLLLPDTAPSAGQWNLPIRYGFNYSTGATDNLNILVSAEYIPQFGLYPTVMGGLGWNKKNFLLSVEAGLNKAGQFSSGIGIGYLGKQFFAQARSAGVEGFFTSNTNTSVYITSGFLF